MIALACDHGALELKEAIKAHLTERGLAYKDFGTYTKDSCDYPDFGAAAARAVASGECERGIVCCTTGIGISIAANKVKGIRCALLHDHMSARLTRQHNDANMMALGAAITPPCWPWSSSTSSWTPNSRAAATKDGWIRSALWRVNAV